MYKKNIKQPGILRSYISKIWLIMRLTTFLLLITFLHTSASSLAQKVSLSKRNAPLAEIFKEIRQQSGVDFVFTTSTLKDSKPVNIQVENVELREVLQLVFEGQPLEYSLSDRSVVVKRRTRAFGRQEEHLNESFALGMVLAYPEVRGRLVDSLGRPLEGASVRVLNAEGRVTSLQTKSDRNGLFILNNVPENAMLEITYLGFQKKLIRTAADMGTVTLIQEMGQLKDVDVVFYTGYEKISKERSAGSFTQIDNETLNTKVGANILDRLEDLVPGMQKVANSKTRPLSNFEIRGLATINANSDPLLVVDNFIYEGDPNTINPNDVESVTILKDATAASIWGVRAGNGVIVITTKQGKLNQSTHISLTSNVTVTQKPDLMSIPSIPSKDLIELEKRRFMDGYFDLDLLNTTNYAVLPVSAEILNNARSGLISEEEASRQLDALAKNDIREDAYRYLLQSGIAQQYGLNISGGSNHHHYFGSIGYDKSRPIDISRNDQRLSMRFNNTWKPFEQLSISGEMNWTKSNSNNYSSLSSYGSVLGNPYNSLKDSLGNNQALPKDMRDVYKNQLDEPGMLDWAYVPLDEAYNGNKEIGANNIRLAGLIDYLVIPGLNANVSYSWQTNHIEDVTIEGLETYATRHLINRFVTTDANGSPIYPYPLGGVHKQLNTNQDSWNFRSTVRYDKQIQDHQLNAFAGFEVREATIEELNYTNYGYNASTGGFQSILPGQWAYKPGLYKSTIAFTLPRMTGNLNRYSSLFANGGYTYKNTYILNASARVDQSNFFGVEANDRRVPLWSVGAAWLLSNEPFFNHAWVSQLKLRLSYGYSGNTNAGTSPLSTIRYNNKPADMPSQLATVASSPNPALKWEKVRNTNLGVDFHLFGNRISGSVDLYDKRGLDLISGISLAPSSGFKSYTGNQSSIKAKGIDIMINSLNIQGPVSWRSVINFAYNSEEVTSYTVALPTGFISPWSVGTNSYPIIGRPLSSLYVYDWAGLDPMDGDARFYLNGQIANSVDYSKARLNDYVFAGRRTAPVFGSTRQDLTWRSFVFSVNISYKFGHYFQRPSFYGEITKYVGGFQHDDYLRAWKKPGDELITNVPAFLDNALYARNTVYRYSTTLIDKADYIYLQDLRLSYDLNQSRVNGLPLKSIRLHAFASNLGFVWKSSSYNPIAGMSWSNAESLMPKTFSIGISANF